MTAAKLIQNLGDFPTGLHGGAVAVGNFDGVHRGHASLVAELCQQAREVGGPAIVLTFDPPPVAVLNPSKPLSKPLTSIERRAELLGSLGVDAMVAYPTDKALLELSPEAFFRTQIVEVMRAKAMVEGPNFRFGKDRAGDTILLQKLCDSSGLRLTVVAAKMATQPTDEHMISSTRVRHLLSEGDFIAVNQLLTQPYQISGVVARGAQRGRLLGFPTANLEGIDCLTPPRGVYAGVSAATHLPAAIHIGPNPTFGDHQDKVEVHLIDWHGEIYGDRLHCVVLQKVRDVRKFDGQRDLIQQLELDIEACKQIVAMHQSA